MNYLDDPRWKYMRLMLNLESSRISTQAHLDMDKFLNDRLRLDSFNEEAFHSLVQTHLCALKAAILLSVRNSYGMDHVPDAAVKAKLFEIASNTIRAFAQNFPNRIGKASPAHYYDALRIAEAAALQVIPTLTMQTKLK